MIWYGGARLIIGKAKQHARRVQEKLGADDGLIYLPGEPARNNEDSDMPAPFRQRRYFYYLSGFVFPSSPSTMRG
jgi:Xaa-Pro dipeptidase